MDRKMVTLMVMHDSGKSYTVRLQNFYYKCLCIMTILIPILLCLTITVCYYLWNDNKMLNANALHLQNETNKAIALTENLVIFKKILDEEHPINASVVAINQAEELSDAAELSNAAELSDAAKVGDAAKPSDANKPSVVIEQDEKIETLAEQIGPGHTEFPTIDTKEVAVENLNSRILDDGKIRISLDLRNPDPTKIVTGYVNSSFVNPNGKVYAFDIAANLKTFKINRFKRVVFLPNMSTEILDENGSILIEVFNKADKLMYRNVTPIEQ